MVINSGWSIEWGLICVVGRGSDINVLCDPWLIQNDDLLVSIVQDEADRDLVVRDLILDDYSGWNTTLVHQKFNRSDA